MTNGIWQKLSQTQIQDRINSALKQNVSFINQSVLGVPGSFLDTLVFDQEANFLEDAPFLRTLLENPNHIGCHTLDMSEPFFEGSHAIERELLEICAVEILQAQAKSYDGYVASGGTEANIQALWIYRNYFQQDCSARLDEILVLGSEDTHYSIDKAANLLALDVKKIPVDENDRDIDQAAFQQILHDAKTEGKTCIIFIGNMMTTMFGSVDNIDAAAATLEQSGLSYKIHVDGAYGGFYYPFSDPQNSMTFANSHISSFTLDAHKMAQAPYGTGIFLIRKGLIEYANTQEASYVRGEDYTLVGSRSGANAIASWMILSRHGKQGWFDKIRTLQARADGFAKGLDGLGIQYFRNPFSNIITMRSEFVAPALAERNYLVPDDHHSPAWQKIVVMEHVTQARLDELLSALA